MIYEVLRMLSATLFSQNLQSNTVEQVSSNPTNCAAHKAFKLNATEFIRRYILNI